MSVGAGAVGGGTRGDESGTGVLSTSSSGTGRSPLGGSSATSPAASSCCWRIMKSVIYKDRLVDKT